MSKTIRDRAIGFAVALCLVVGGAWSAAAVSAQNDRSNLLAGTNATSTTGEVLAAAHPVWEVAVQNDPDSTTDILVGNRSAQVIQLAPGQSVTIPTDNLNRIWIVAVSGTPTANYIARGR